MPLSIEGHIIPDVKFTYPFRCILSGSSGSGKTEFAKKLISRDDIFNGKITQIRYYQPCSMEYPVDWHNTLTIPVTYKQGLPSENELMEMEENAVIILDDLYEKAIQSQAIDHLFRIISRKRCLNETIMTHTIVSKGTLCSRYKKLMQFFDIFPKLYRCYHK